MAAGGMYDHLGGGFHRYSTDGYWLVPHFEKMLYDNAQLARCYLHAWQLLGKPRYRVVATETLDYLLREMRHPQGGFFSAQDADTEEGEGAYFTWTPDEVRAALSAEEAAAVESDLRTDRTRQLRGKEHPPSAEEELRGRARRTGACAGPRGAARDPGHAPPTRPRREDPRRLERAGAGGVRRSRGGLRFARVPGSSRAGRRVHPERVDGRYGQRFARGLRQRHGAKRRLLHSWKDGRRSGDAFLDDYACVAEGLLALYGCTLEERWFAAARDLIDDLAERFPRPAGGFYDTSVDHESLITRPRATYDSPTPTGNSMAAMVLLKMAGYTGENRYRELAEDALDSLASGASAAPVMSGQWLSAALLAEEGTTEVAVVGDLADPRGRALLATVRDGFRPFVVLAARPAGAPSQIPLLLEREPGAGVPAAAWLCRHSTCAPPTTDPAELLRLLGAQKRGRSPGP